MKDIPLTGGFQPVQIAPGGYTLQAPGLIGRVRQQTSAERTTRGDSGVYEQSLNEAIGRSELQATDTFEILVTADNAQAPDGAHRADGLDATARGGEPAMILTMPRLGDVMNYATLYTDAAGVSRWIFPDHIDEPGEGAAGAGEVVFYLPRATPYAAAPDTDAEAKRGPLVAAGRCLVRMLFWATDKLIGRPALEVATLLEKPKHPYGFHLIRPQRYQFPDPQGEAVDWDAMQEGRALLFVHGTFSTAEASFAHLSRETLEQLAAHYGQRLLAFNHPTVYHAPADNIRAFLQMLPDGTRLELDIVTHSRGGLVGRELCERWQQHVAPEHGIEIKVNKAVLVASPNSGTTLVDANHDTDLLDRYTNLLVGLPDSAFTLSMEGILMALQILGHGVLAALPGLRCFHPSQSDYLDALNALPASGTTYYAIGADYTPADTDQIKRIFRLVGDRFLDTVFAEPNDAVVPARGTYTGASAGRPPLFEIPAARRVIYNDPDNPVWHITYFSSPAVNRQLLSWLTV